VYPINLRLTKKKCVVVGGGEVALRKVRGLLAADAAITVVAPQVVRELRKLAELGKIAWLPQNYAPGLLAGSFLTICATNNQTVNKAVALEAKATGILVNAPAEPELSDFFVPSVLRRGQVMFTVSTDGLSPALSRALREKMERDFPPAYGEWLETVASIRQEMKHRLASSREREEFWRAALSAEILALIQAGKLKQAEVELRYAADGFGLKPQDSPGYGTGAIRT